MPATTYWHVEKRVITTHYEGELTEADMAQSRADLNAFVTNGEPPCILLIDVRDVTKLPPNFKSTLDGMEQFRNHNQIVQTVVVSNNPLFNFFSVLASKFFDMPINTYQSLAEADQFIERYLSMLTTGVESQ